MNKTLIQGGDQDEALRILMADIIRGARAKMVDPVIGESRKLAAMMGDLHNQERQELEKIKARIDRLEEAVQATPLILLAAIKEAINQAGLDGKA